MLGFRDTKYSTSTVSLYFDNSTDRAMYFPVTDHDFSHLRHVADFLRVETIVAIVKNGFARGRRYPYRALTDLWCKLVHRSEEHTSELQSLMRISYAVFCL